MKILEIIEARRNPSQNIRQHGHEHALQVIQDLFKKGVTNVGVRMTSIAKLGLNPKGHTNFKTPYGLYFYPADYYKKIKETGDDLPFEDDANYIQIFKYDTNNILYIDNLDYEDTHEIWTSLSKFNKEHLNDKYDLKDIWSSSNANALVNNNPGGRLWYVLWRMANGNTVLWNKLLRIGLGKPYDVVIDNGAGIIHENEPYQGLVLKPRVVKHITEIKQSYKNINHWSYNEWLKYVNTLKQRIDQNNEKHILKYPQIAMLYWYKTFYGRRWKELEHKLETDQDYIKFIMEYCRYTLAWIPSLKPILSKPENLVHALEYTIYYLKRPFKEIETNMANAFINDKDNDNELNYAIKHYIHVYLKEFYNLPLTNKAATEWAYKILGINNENN